MEEKKRQAVFIFEFQITIDRKNVFCIKKKLLKKPFEIDGYFKSQSIVKTYFTLLNSRFSPLSNIITEQGNSASSLIYLETMRVLAQDLLQLGSLFWSLNAHSALYVPTIIMQRDVLQNLIIFQE